MRLSACLCLFLCSLARADEFDALLDSIKSDYHSGRYQQALGSLQAVQNKLAEARLALLNGAIPEQLDGWTQVDVVNPFEQTGLAECAQKKFVQGEKRVHFIIGPDQPLLAATLQLSGNSSDRIQDIPVKVFYDQNRRLGQVGFSPAPALLVVVKGENLDRQELLMLSSRLRLDLLRGFK